MFKPCGGYAPTGPIRYGEAGKLGSVKLDGIRCVTTQGTAFTKTMKHIPNHHVRNSLGNFPNLDGELICGAPNVEGVYNSTFSGVMTLKGEPEFTFYVFDDLSDLNRTYKDRLKRLNDRQLPDWIKVLGQVAIKNQQDLESYYATALSGGYEGIIIRDPNAFYKFGKYTAESQDLLKYKPLLDFEAEIVEVYEAQTNTNEAYTNEVGSTKRSTDKSGLVPKGQVGGFVCRRIPDGLRFNCAPGKFKKPDLIAMWKDQPIGKILKVQSMGYGASAAAPRHARALGFRSLLDM